MEGDCVGADDEIPHPMGVQCGDELFVILGWHPALVSSDILQVRPQPFQHVLQGAACHTRIENPLLRLPDGLLLPPSMFADCLSLVFILPYWPRVYLIQQRSADGLAFRLAKL